MPRFSSPDARVRDRSVDCDTQPRGRSTQSDPQNLLPTGVVSHHRSTTRSVIIDDREARLFDRIVERFPEVSASRARLLTGDVHIVDGSGHDAALVLERKTRADLRASLMDGRFHAQRARMVAEFGRDGVAFAIEGGSDWTERESGAEVALVLRDRVPVFWTKDVDDTAALIARLAGADLTRRAAPPCDDNAVRVAQASTGSAEKSLASMLRCVPGVSSRRATALAAEFRSMAELATRIREDRAGTEMRIANCKVDDRSSRLGPALAHRVAACVAGTR